MLPRQPKLQQYPITEISGIKRSFRAEWFEKWPWLEYQVETNKATCHNCRVIKYLQLLSFSKNDDSAFSEAGFQNWKKHPNGLMIIRKATFIENLL